MTLQLTARLRHLNSRSHPLFQGVYSMEINPLVRGLGDPPPPSPLNVLSTKSIYTSCTYRNSGPVDIGSCTIKGGWSSYTHQLFVKTRTMDYGSVLVVAPLTFNHLEWFLICVCWNVKNLHNVWLWSSSFQKESNYQFSENFPSSNFT